MNFGIPINLYVLIVILISECFIEAIPQTHLTLIMLAIDYESIMFGISTELDSEINTDMALFLVGFISSILSASLGLARFLMNGPSKLVKKQGQLGGYLQVGFALLFFSILLTLVSKAWLLAFVLLPKSPHPLDKGNPLYSLVWMGISLVPQLMLVRFFFQSLIFEMHDHFWFFRH